MPRHIHSALGFDFGMKKIGVAIGQLVTNTASPLSPVKATDGIPEWDQIISHINQWHPDILLVGLPLNMDGTDQDITHAARKFARRLTNTYNLPVEMVDERLTTRSALSDFDKTTRKKISLDSLAAVLIVESWLRDQPNETC